VQLKNENRPAFPACFRFSIARIFLTPLQAAATPHPVSDFYVPTLLRVLLLRALAIIGR
jgi:hypothetical protein